MKATCHFARGPTRARRFTFYLLALVLLGLPGCKGCRDTKTLTKSELDEKVAEEKKKKQEEEKEPFEWGRVYSLPNDMERMNPYFKPGHWTEFIAEAWANQADFSGELVTDPFRLTDPITGKDVVPYRLGTSRPALLPKQQKKHLGLVLFVPPGDSGRHIHFRLTPRGSSRSVKEQLITAQRLKSWCYNFLVLAANPIDYQQLLKPRGGMDSLHPPMEGPQHEYYNLRVPKIDRYVPVSENSLAWTSTAYILWDGIDPALLTTDQQKALIDWLHWGGQLVISGPDSLDLLKDSFLSPYLPATVEGDITLTKDDFKTFGENWTNKPWTVSERERIEAAKAKGPKAKAELGKPRPLTIVQPWSGKKLTPIEDEDVEVLAKSDRPDGAPLVLDRRVGLGRIALTAFRLSQKELRLSAWPSFDAFLNGCLLRHPPREFVAGTAVVKAVVRDPDKPYTPARPRGNPFNPVDGQDPDTDPDFARRVRESMRAELVSRVRYFTRDAALGASLKVFSEAEGLESDRQLDNSFLIDDRPSGATEFHQFAAPPGRGDPDEELASPQNYSCGSGVAGWSDFNHPSQLVRHALADSAGIVIPKANYVVGLLAIYLAVLVPLNWLVFRIINRVEWAWIAAPIITIAFTVVVIRFAELNVGFARSRTEIAVVEIQGEHPRAHVTRYTGVYTSLATSYDVEFDDPSSVIQPYAAHSRAELNDPKNPIFMRDSSTVQFRRDDKQITLTGFDVSSNSTGMLHAEHMLDLGGGIAARQVRDNTFELTNRTKLSLKGAAVLSRAGAAWIGDLDSKAKTTVTLAPRSAGRVVSAASAAAKAVAAGDPADGDEPGALNQLEQGIRTALSDAGWFTEREQDQITARAGRDDVLKARLLVRLAENADTLADGELRLVAWTKEELPGMQISPGASQTRFANVVVAHLRYGKLSDASWWRDDRNEDLRSREEVQFRNKQFRPFDDPEMPDGDGLDLDGDGAADVPADPAAIPSAAQAFIRRHDRNRDGVLDRNEWSRNSVVPLEDLDTDSNGKVNAAELEAYFRKQFESPPP